MPKFEIETTFLRAVTDRCVCSTLSHGLKHILNFIVAWRAVIG